MALIKNKIYYTYEDVTIMPNVLSNVEHRSECIPFDEEGMLPLFTAPMDTVVNNKNFEKFENEMIHAILPRTEDLTLRVSYSLKGRWAAYSLTEFEKVFCDEKNKLTPTNKDIKALIDVANGHMIKIIELARAAKNIYGDEIILMAGNIANPNTYEEYARVGIQFCRVGIGGGCFIGNTKITLSDNSKKEIKDIKIGDTVKTINGCFNVIGTKKEKTNNLVKINNSITCTQNHKFLVINKEDKERINDSNINDFAYYVEAEMLDKNKHFLVKCLS